MIGKFHLAGIARESESFCRSDVAKHLICSCRNYVNGPIANFYLRPVRVALPTLKCTRRWHVCRAVCDDRFQMPDRGFIRTSADVPRSVVVIVGIDAGDLAVPLDTSCPI